MIYGERSGNWVNEIPRRLDSRRSTLRRAKEKMHDKDTKKDNSDIGLTLPKTEFSPM